MDQVELSAIVTSYYEEKSLDEFYARLRRTLEATGRTFEIILVNDGSTDATLERQLAIRARDHHVAVVDLLRNSGQGCAMTAGINAASGKHFIFIDSDLQLDPEELPTLLAELDRGADVVSGYRAQRRDSILRTLPSRFANRVLRRVTRAPLRDFGCTFKVYRGTLIRAMELGPHKPYGLLLLRCAQRFKEVQVSHHPRKYGKSGWTFSKLFYFNLANMLASDGIFQGVSLIAFAIAALTFLRIVIALFVPGGILGAPVTTGMILNCVLLATAMLLMVTALVGEYVVRIHSRLWALPYYIVRDSWPKRLPDPVTTTSTASVLTAPIKEKVA